MLYPSGHPATWSPLANRIHSLRFVFVLENTVCTFRLSLPPLVRKKDPHDPRQRPLVCPGARHWPACLPRLHISSLLASRAAAIQPTLPIKVQLQLEPRALSPSKLPAKTTRND